MLFIFFFFNDTATTEIYTLSLHDALPISTQGGKPPSRWRPPTGAQLRRIRRGARTRSQRDHADGCPSRMPGTCRLPKTDRKSTRLNSSHANISYAVFCLKKKKQNNSYIYN